MKVTDAEAYQRSLDLMNQIYPQPENHSKQYPHNSLVVCVSVWLSRCIGGRTWPDHRRWTNNRSGTYLSKTNRWLIRDLCIKKNVGCMLVTHDIDWFVSNVTDRVAVSCRDLVEFGPTKQVLGTWTPIHAHSLISAVPRSDRKLDRFPLVMATSKKHMRWKP